MRHPPPWFVAWAPDYADRDEPPWTPEPPTIRARLDALGWLARWPEPTGPRAAWLRRLMEWIRGVKA